MIKNVIGSYVQFINGIKKTMTFEIMKELTTIKKTSQVTSEQVLAWANRVEVETLQKAMLDTKH